MNWTILLEIASVALPVGILMFRGFKNISTALASISVKVNNLESRSRDLDSDMKEIKNNLISIGIQLAKLETRVEERTLRVIHIEKTSGEK